MTYRRVAMSAGKRWGKSLAAELEGFGGVLRCETCRRTQPMQPGAASSYTSNGWPTCCGYTMRWWTQRQIDAGEMPA